MVKALSDTDKNAFAQAIKEAERATSAELAVVVAPASDTYQSYLLLYGLVAGSAVDTGLWAAKTIITFPLLLAIQLAAMALLCFIPWPRRACLRLVPRHVAHARAAHRAYEEYLIVSKHTPAATPIVLLYISLAERYAHILASRAVREVVTDAQWNEVIQELTAAMPAEGLQAACLKAVRRATGLLTPHFPKNGEVHKA